MLYFRYNLGDIIMKKVFIILLPFILIGCATTYQEYGPRGGYEAVHINDNIFKVSFTGNAFIGTRRSQDYALLRCAEVTLENGYNYFMIIDDESYMKQELYTKKDSYYEKPISAETYGTDLEAKKTYTFRKRHIIHTILCLKEEPEFSIDAYDAERIVRRIRKKYNFKD